ncbi:uncharacterized protein LOC106638656 [Copidosoma floridanum]|uniref:uncharacterized protein LOC106638656 n=1 Tax=Copidosoma floridanum TaxID=29053 RepID=UPI0006C9BC83|nr:uncharacterized protein LOC106638656 [Copidosoma floridanum]
MLLGLVILGNSAVASREFSGPQKRSLLFPNAANPAQLLLIFGLGTPLQLERESVILGSFAKAIYNLPTNASQLDHQRDSKPASRWSLYRHLGHLAELYNLGGRSCVLRAICEAAAGPFEPAHGLLQQLLQLFFSPSSSEPEPYEEQQDREYEVAERMGARGSPDVCRDNFQRDCPVSLLDAFTAPEQTL